MIVGTPSYMSPEQILGGEVDARSDLYSLAVVTYETLTGRRLVSASDLVSAFFSVLSQPAPRLSRALPGVPAAGDEIFAAALAKEPSRRPSSVEAWVEAFVPILDRLPAVGSGWAVTSRHGLVAGSGDATTRRPNGSEA
jgi:serine/threonine protein kinase